MSSRPVEKYARCVANKQNRGKPKKTVNKRRNRNVSKTKSAVTSQSQRTSSRIRPPVINLDVTYSSHSDNDSDVQDIQPASPPPNQVTVATSDRTVQEKNSSDSSDCEVFEDFGKKGRSCNSDDEDCEDLYRINYKADLLKSYEVVQKMIRGASDRKVKRKKVDDQSTLHSSICSEDSINLTNDDLVCDSSVSITDSKQSPKFDISIEKLKTSYKPRQNRKIKRALASLQAFSKRLQEDITSCSTDHEKSADDVIVLDNEHLKGMNVRVRWGSSYIKVPVYKNEKFSSVYQHLAEKHCVSVAQVVLSFKDRVISPDSKLSDLGLSIADIIEGGLISKTSSPLVDDTSGRKSQRCIEDKDTITLKIQTSNRKESINLSINKYDKMSLLMEKYAKIKNVDVRQLKFLFDGETIESSDTPLSLDLEGGECIDVFEQHNKH